MGKKTKLPFLDSKVEKNKPKLDFFADDSHDNGVFRGTVEDDSDEQDGAKDADVLTDESDIGIDPVQERRENAPNEDTVQGYKVKEVEGGVEVVSRGIPHPLDETVTETTSGFNPGFTIRKRIKPEPESEDYVAESSDNDLDEDDDIGEE